MPKIKNILFICYANTCRSPAAEYFAKKLKKSKYKEELKGVNFDSAGWHNAFDHAQPETINYVKEKGIDMSDFRPKKITRDLLKKQDLIISMEKYQLIKIGKKFKDIAEKFKDNMFTLKQFNGEKKDFNIPDPYKTGIESYNRILKIIEKNVEKLIKKIVDINNLN